MNQVASLVDSERPTGPAVNVSQPERWASILAGGALGIYGAYRRDLPGLLLAALGGAIAYRGLTGHCYMYEALDINTARDDGARASIPAGEGVRVEESIIVNRPVAEVFGYWRRLSNLPQFMTHLESVTETDSKHSHWVAQGPMGLKARWDAEIITERENELIGWRSLPGSTVATAGSVHFRPSPAGWGTQIDIVLKYEPPAGKVGVMIARLFGRSPRQEISCDLQRFKELLESPESSAIEGHYPVGV
jgi:uncharacterized membrane protein